MAYASGGHTGPNKPDKGDQAGSCNVTACQRAGATWFNHSTRRWYCGECAVELNKANSDYPEMFGKDHELCTEDKAAIQILRERSPYGEMCMKPEQCAGIGHCPRDPNCGD